MNLSEDDIRRAIINFQNTHKKKGYQMTELLGMSSPSMYSQYINKITQELKATYLVSFIYNTKIDLNEFLNQNIESKDEESEGVDVPDIKQINCTECISKQKEIDALKTALEAKEELLQMYRDKKKAAS